MATQAGVTGAGGGGRPYRGHAVAQLHLGSDVTRPLTERSAGLAANLPFVVFVLPFHRLFHHSTHFHFHFTLSPSPVK